MEEREKPRLSNQEESGSESPNSKCKNIDRERLGKELQSGPIYQIRKMRYKSVTQPSGARV